VLATKSSTAARSPAKRWLERQVEFVRTTENGSLNFHIVEATWHLVDGHFTQQHCLDLPQPLLLTGTKQPVQEHQGRRLNAGGKSLSEGRPRSGLSGS